MPPLALVPGRQRAPARRPERPGRRRSTYAANVQIRTGYGLARAELDGPGSPDFLLVLTHGSAGGVDTPDLLAVRDTAVQLGGAVARVLQPYRVRGARAPGSAARQDAAWLEIISVLRARYAGLPLVQGGRSNGARVACRTARAAGARAVLALAFPLHPPGRPERSRAAELREAGTAVLAVSGDRDAFGVPGSADAGQVVVLPGETHALSRNPAAVGDAVRAWLPEALALPRPAR
jgi:predicted alpha/beta-hydrolase family hydrolase